MKHLPNTLTCLNLFCGCVAAYFAFSGNFPYALGFIVGGAVFDFFDGFCARLVGASSPLGKELDSLADDVTFGFVPAAIVFSLLQNKALPLAGLGATATTLIPFAAFLIAVFSALRLAKFNLDTRQTTVFIGMPTPANALFWASLAVRLDDTAPLPSWTLWPILAGIALSCWLMVSETPMLALKFKDYAWKRNLPRYLLIGCGIILIGAWGYGGLAATIVLYVLLSLFCVRKIS